ncbi:MAG: hypothetical protein MUC68_04000 [Burkholderiaceae bacterium]|jgi:hypothetical protein|nr:hypothetical protein [Burkholderiaceae bacterium]
MTPMMFTRTTGLLLLATAGSVYAGANDHRSTMSPPLSQPAQQSVQGVREVLRHDARQRIEQAVRDTTGGRHRVTSRDRSGPLASRAHDRGAIDVVTPRTGTPQQLREAREISRRLGPSFNATVEETYGGGRPGQSRYIGPAFDRHTTFNNGVQGRTRIVPPRASGNHTHVQPNYGIDRRGGGQR